MKLSSCTNDNSKTSNWLERNWRLSTDVFHTSSGKRKQRARNKLRKSVKYKQCSQYLRDIRTWKANADLRVGSSKILSKGPVPSPCPHANLMHIQIKCKWRKRINRDPSNKPDVLLLLALHVGWHQHAGMIPLWAAEGDPFLAQYQLEVLLDLLSWTVGIRSDNSKGIIKGNANPWGCGNIKMAKAIGRFSALRRHCAQKCDFMEVSSGHFNVYSIFFRKLNVL